MLIVRVPYRISFFGGGTDYPDYFTKYGGEVISTTIDKYCYLTVRELPPFFEHKHHIVYSTIEAVRDIDEIHHPSVRECLRHMNLDKGLEIHHDGDLPARSGIGSSSAFTVGLIHALYTMQGKEISKLKLADEAIYIEQKVIKESVGCQDQIATAFGGLNHITFNKDCSYEVNQVPCDYELLQNHLMLVFTGFPHMANDIAKTYEFDNSGLHKMKDMVSDAKELLLDGDIESFGELLGHSWSIKKQLSPQISTPYIDYVYERAIKAGAYGGKLIGAGGGGFMLFVAHPDNQDKIKEALKGLLFVPFKFENKGSQIVFSNGVA